MIQVGAGHEAQTLTEEKDGGNEGFWTKILSFLTNLFGAVTLAPY